MAVKWYLFCFQMLLEEKADALREEAEEMTTVPGKPNTQGKLIEEVKRNKNSNYMFIAENI